MYKTNWVILPEELDSLINYTITNSQKDTHKFRSNRPSLSLEGKTNNDCKLCAHSRIKPVLRSKQDIKCGKSTVHYVPMKINKDNLFSTLIRDQSFREQESLDPMKFKGKIIKIISHISRLFNNNHLLHGSLLIARVQDVKKYLQSIIWLIRPWHDNWLTMYKMLKYILIKND